MGQTVGTQQLYEDHDIALELVIYALGICKDCEIQLGSRKVA